MVRFLSVLTIFLIFYKCNALSEGDTCTLETGSKGICRDYNKCPKAIKLYNEEGIMPIVCNYDNLIVCCEKEKERPVGEIAKKMCKEYGKEVFQLVKPPVLTAGLVNSSTCARTSIALVAGGKNANPAEFPHMALLGYGSEDNFQWRCGGSLISERYVITAGHCEKDRNLGDISKVRLGELDHSRDNDDAEPVDFKPEKIIVHPERRPPSRYHDIALIKLDKTVSFTKYVRPICLHTSYNVPLNNAESLIPRFSVSGWGLTEQGAPSAQLKHTALDLSNHESCKEAYKRTSKKKLERNIDDQSQICAIGGVGNDTCQGDSGGPLQIYLEKPYCMYGLVGVTSFGKNPCGEVHAPGVYTRVSYYIKWIEDIVWPQ